MNELMTVAEERSVQDVTDQVVKIQDMMKSIMHDGEHYGIIPGTGKKPSLLKSGAEKLCFVFRLVPEFQIERDDLPGGHREYRVKCTLKTMGANIVAGEGVGSCSTMESKYRYRNASDYEVLDDPIPKDAREKKAEYRKKGFGMKQVDGAWVWVRYTSEGKVENPDIADVYNTVLKMAKKRAHVDATITACAASDIFTQDIEDFAQPDEGQIHSVSAMAGQALAQQESPALSPQQRAIQNRLVAASESLNLTDQQKDYLRVNFKGEALAAEMERLAALKSVGGDISQSIGIQPDLY